jgi:type VI protein secretion system component Hcp
MMMFMKVGSIEGDVTAESYKGWITIDSCGFGFDFEEDDVRNGLAQASPATGRALPNVSTFDVEKKTTDRSAPILMRWMVDGDPMDKVQIDVCDDTFVNGKFRCDLRYLMKRVVLTQYSIDLENSEKGDISISMKFSFDELSVERIGYGTDNMARASTKTITSKRPK